MSVREFRYRAVTSDGAEVGGDVRAFDERAVGEWLRHRQLLPLAIKARPSLLVRRGGPSARDLADGFAALATLLEAGMPVLRAVQILQQLAPASWQSAFEVLNARLREGASLSHAMRDADLRLPPVVVSVLLTGERAGALTESVRLAAAHLDRKATTRAAVTSALAYPLLLCLAGTASVAVLLAFVLPRFAEIVSDAGQELPLLPALLLKGSTAIGAYFAPVGLFLMLLIVGAVAHYKTPRGAGQWSALLLRAPVIGRMRSAATTSQTCHAMAMLLRSGVSPGAALHHARMSAEPALMDRLAAAQGDVQEGIAFAAALERRQVLTDVGIRFARAGEESGRLADMLARAAELEDARATAMLKRGVTMLEPALILGFGLAVAVVAAAMLQAMYGMRIAT